MARHRHLVKAAADREPDATPALPDAPDFGDQSENVYQPEEQPEDVLADPPDMRDISAELNAPPRRKLPWPTLLLTSGVVAVLAFTGGVLVEKGQSSGSSAPGGGAAAGGARFGGAGGPGAGGAGGQAPGGGNAAGAGSGMTAGTVKVVDGSTIYVTDAQGNIIKVNTGKSTQVSVAKNGKVSDLKPGQTVTVRGSQSSSGDITATTVTEGGSTPGGFGGRGGQPSASSGG
ncbi:hypothetical protein [Actinacidiphila soli]|uniref:hypothetical protein n=1 Tax=Actinacidiphila soli TaxID=2487275 RepID=UPI000FCAA94E|nr:hypothetical protein [Actinacidiphila soli]